MAAFLLSHGLPANPRLRGPLMRLLGARGFFVAYSLLSLSVVAWLAHAYAAAPYIELWPQEPWTRWVPPLAMAPACLLLVIGLSSPNPYSLGLGRRRYNPARPGIVGLVHHPVIWALTLWAAAHLFPNGDLASLVLFGPLLALSLSGPRVLDRRRARDLGEDWVRLAPRLTPPPALLAQIGPWRMGGGILLYAILLYLHPLVIGASPLPL
ncbi:MAG: hypothetical protein HQL38_09025 [Alphaproteobacteria bacterium]|nr:hypothetical protein [Alphaproteobacteria bacterium]